MNNITTNHKKVPFWNLKIKGKEITAMTFFGVLGFICAMGLCFFLVFKQALDPMVLFAICGVIAATFFAVAYIFLFIKGNETLVFYRYEIAILATSSLALWLFDVSVLTYLDIVSMGIGTFLAFGRWGCLFVGCCHGRPCNCKLGVVYSQEHTEDGFPHYFVGLKMFPMPVLESLTVFIIVGMGTWIILSNLPVGTAFLWYSVVYGLSRFVFEFFRADTDRPYWLGFSEAQWTTLILIEFTFCLSYLDFLPVYSWHAFFSIGLILFMLMIAAIRKRWPNPKYLINQPDYIEEVAGYLKQFEIINTEQKRSNPERIPVIQTSLGLKLSFAETETSKGKIAHYTVSGVRISKLRRLKKSQKLIFCMAKILMLIRHRNEPFQIRPGAEGIYHILFKS